MCIRSPKLGSYVFLFIEIHSNNILEHPAMVCIVNMKLILCLLSTMRTIRKVHTFLYVQQKR